jgi:hypothetical protein
VQRKQYKVSGVNKGFFSSYVPIIFNSPYSSFLEVGIHTVILDYKYRNSTLNEQCISINEPVVAIINIKDKQSINESKTSKDLIEYLFSNNKRIAEEIRIEKVDEVYNKYVLPLKDTLKELKSKFLQLTSVSVIT